MASPMGHTLREGGKTLVFSAYVALARGRSRHLSATGRQRISVLCYHRVNDELNDNVTLQAEQFNRHMAFIRRHYPVASVADIVGGRIDRKAKRPIVAITFDDGYRDNYENAAPILAQHTMPAAFFVSTGMIGSDRGFSHDLEKHGRMLATMNWDQVRELHQRGFEIGAHTVSHINLARVEEPVARLELIAARDEIRRQLQIDDVAFAYCFGGRNDITPARRALVRELGYTCCMAAYGGTNEGEIDLFDIKRFGVSGATSQAALEARIEGWRS